MPPNYLSKLRNSTLNLKIGIPRPLSRGIACNHCDVLNFLLPVSQGRAGESSGVSNGMMCFFSCLTSWVKGRCKSHGPSMFEPIEKLSWALLRLQECTSHNCVGRGKYNIQQRDRLGSAPGGVAFAGGTSNWSSSNNMETSLTRREFLCQPLDNPNK
jgi:hypothetical protein